MDVEEEAIGGNSEKRREAFDGVDKGDGDFGGCGGRENMSAELKEGEREGRGNHLAGGVADAVFEGCDMGA